MELNTDITEKIYEACTIGRKENIIKNNYKILEVLVKGENLQLNLIFNE